MINVIDIKLQILTIIIVKLQVKQKKVQRKKKINNNQKMKNAKLINDITKSVSFKEKS